jgi:tRNA A-37 threonylcarbamoyl transferase component Bud32
MLPKLSNREFDVLTQGARILEEDPLGLKVLRLPDARILKLFRRKRLLSSQLWAPHALRFDQNAKALLKRGIPTISVEQIFELPEMQLHAVLYNELPGTTLRQWLREHEGDEARALTEKFGRFVAKLHAEGVLFRSLHFGNVLVTPDQDLALIDIVDMSFRRSGSLSTQERIRNFAHIGRYTEDRKLFTQTGEQTFIEAYLSACQCSPKAHALLERAFFESLHATTKR